MTTSTVACQTKQSELLSSPRQQQTFGKYTTLCVCVLCVSDTVDEDDDLYDFVEDEENKGDEIYEDLMRTEEPPEIVGCRRVAW